MIVSLRPCGIAPRLEYFILKKGVVGGKIETLCENFDLFVNNIFTRSFLLSSNPLIFTTLGFASKAPLDPTFSYLTIKNINLK